MRDLACSLSDARPPSTSALNALSCRALRAANGCGPVRYGRKQFREVRTFLPNRLALSARKIPVHKSYACNHLWVRHNWETSVAAYSTGVTVPPLDTVLHPPGSLGIHSQRPERPQPSSGM